SRRRRPVERLLEIARTVVLHQVQQRAEPRKMSRPDQTADRDTVRKERATPELGSRSLSRGEQPIPKAEAVPMRNQANQCFVRSKGFDSRGRPGGEQVDPLQGKESVRKPANGPTGSLVEPRMQSRHRLGSFTERHDRLRPQFELRKAGKHRRTPRVYVDRGEVIRHDGTASSVKSRRQGGLSPPRPSREGEDTASARDRARVQDESPALMEQEAKGRS